MTQGSEEDLWDLAFSKVGREDDRLGRNSDDVARAIYTICEIERGGYKPEGATGAW